MCFCWIKWPKRPKIDWKICLLFVLFLPICYAKWPNFELKNDTIQVELDRGFVPFCAESFRMDIGEEICRQITKQNDSKLKTVVRIALETPIGSHVECNDLGECQISLAIGCTDGVKLECISPQKTINGKCPENWIRFSEAKCIGIVSQTKNSNYEDSILECQNLDSNANLASLSTQHHSKQFDEFLRELSLKIGVEKLLLTSAVRARGQWHWANKVELVNLPKGDAGRCSALDLKSGELVAVDCNEGQYLPLCELNFAKNCVLQNGFYDGEASESISGLPCLRWNDRRVLKNGLFIPVQRHWNHNFCRNPSGLSHTQPWCMVSDSTFQECQVLPCDFGLDFNSDDFGSDKKSRHGNKVGIKCQIGEIRCGTIDQCVAEEFICDYEMDCRNGFDETDCPDFLKNFDLMGEYKLVNEVSEIWTNIPHIQGCAQRCLENSGFRCESFSFEAKKEICLLSKTSDNPAVLFEHLDSFYYRRKFNENTPIKTTKDPETMIIFAEKSDNKAPICIDHQSDENSVRLCSHFGFGQPMLPLFSSSTTNEIVELHNPKWTIECLRDENCTQPVGDLDCRRFLRCSDCVETEFACQLTGECIHSSKVCNGRVDCKDASDEIGCENLEWRLWDGNEGEMDPEGRVQLKFHDTWTDVCADGMEPEQVDRLCNKLGKGTTGRILPISEQTPTAITWFIHCFANECRPIRIQQPCAKGILNIRCENNNSLFCGRRFAQLKKRRRVSRIVGGFDTLPRSFPWSANLRFHDGNTHHCGAVIIHPRFLLSAAHCFEKTKNQSEFYVMTGEWDNSIIEGTEQQFNLSQIHFYPGYEDLFQHDIVILELESNKSIKFNEANQPICLPPRGYRYKPGQICLASGWGTNGTSYPNRLQTAAMPILEIEVCRNSSKVYASVSQTAFCAGYLSGNIDACQGDSGGPFSCEHDGIFYLAGIISWGDGCAQQNNPGIYTMDFEF